MKKILLLLIITMVVCFAFFAYGGSACALAEEEITVINISKEDAYGNVLPYIIAEAKYSRDVVINYSFQTASHFYVKVYEKVDGQFNYIRTSQTFDVVNGKGSYAIIDSGYLRVECIAKSSSTDIASIDTYILSDLISPNAPSIDVDGTMNVVHADPFNVAYVINEDALSGVDYEKSYYKYIGTGGETLIAESRVAESPNKTMINGISANGTLVFRIYDKAGNFNECEKTYSLYNQTANLKPQITVSPSVEEYQKSFYVTIAWPQGTSNKLYRLQINGKEQGKKTYTTPIEITEEGEVKIMAYYLVGGVEHYEEKMITTVDNTPPTSSSIHESISTKIDLTSSSVLTLSVKPFDARSGIKRVYLKHFGTEFSLTDVRTYSLDATDRIGTSVTVVAEDYAGNTVEYAYSLTGFDREKINYYRNTYFSLNKASYDDVAWLELEEAFSRLSHLMSSQDSLSSDILVYSQTVDNKIKGNHTVKVTVEELIDGLTNDFKGTVNIDSTSVKKGGTLNLFVKKSNLESTVLEEKIRDAKSISGIRNATCYAFNLTLKDVNLNDVQVYDYYKFSFSIPSGNIAKVYLEQNGVLTGVSVEIKNDTLTMRTKNQGNFFLVIDKEVVEERKGLTIGDKFFPLDVLLTGGGIVLGVIVFVAILTPIIVYFIKKNKRSGNKFNYFK